MFQIKKSRLRKRRLKWFTYDEYDDSPVLEYFDIETKLIPHVPTIPDNSYDIQNEDLDDDKSVSSFTFLKIIFAKQGIS